MSDFLTDGDFTTASAVSAFRYIAPFAQFGIKTLYVVEQDFVIDVASFSPIDVGTAHPTLAGYFLAIETPYQSVNPNNIVRWTRRYSQVPSSFSRPGGTYNYTFPAILTGDPTTSRFTTKPLTVNSRIQTDFFQTSDPDGITIINPQRYVLTTSPNSDATSQYGEPVVTNAAAFSGTTPSESTYNSWIAGGIELVPEASKITTNWMGNIHMRETIYVKAK